MRIVFMGTPAFAVPSLKTLIESEHDVVGVFTQPPRPAGRGHKVKKSPTHELAEEHDIPVFTPKKLDEDALETLRGLEPSIIVVAAYGMLLPQSALEAAPCINIHPSALPRWRGAAPIQRAILAGDTTTEVCIMHMEPGLDTGPVYRRKQFDIGVNETAGELHDWLAEKGAELLMDVIGDWGAIEAEPQSKDGVTYAHKITPEMRAIDFSKPAQEVHNQIRGLSPWPGATAHLGEEQVKILRSQLVEGKGAPGEVLTADTDNGLVVACGKGALRLRRVQRPGKKDMADVDLLRGFPIQLGVKFK